MEITIREYSKEFIKGAIEVWNEVVEGGIAFPQEEKLDEFAGDEFFASQTYTGIAVREDGEVVGIYILHPNNIGRCGHISNASYAVKASARGLRIGEQLVRHCIYTAKEKGFGILQFNAVVATNTVALRLYEKLGFVKLGTIPKGFRMPDGKFEDIIPHYYEL